MPFSALRQGECSLLVPILINFIRIYFELATIWQQFRVFGNDWQQWYSIGLKLVDLGLHSSTFRQFLGNNSRTVLGHWISRYSFWGSLDQASLIPSKRTVHGLTICSSIGWPCRLPIRQSQFGTIDKCRQSPAC